MFAGYAPIDATQMVVVASTDLAAGLAPAYALGRVTVGILLVGTLLVIAFAVFVARLTIRPITVLSRVAARVEAGDLTARVSLTGGREMRVLGRCSTACCSVSASCCHACRARKADLLDQAVDGGGRAGGGNVRADDCRNGDVGEHGRAGAHDGVDGGHDEPGRRPVCRRPHEPRAQPRPTFGLRAIAPWPLPLGSMRSRASST